MDNGNWVTWCDVDHIEVVSLPYRTRYVVGEMFDPEGLVVQVTHVDGTVNKISEFEYRGESLTADTESVSVYYNYLNQSQVIEVAIEIIELENEAAELINDFEYEVNSDDTILLTGWKQTYKGEPSTKMVIPSGNNIIL